MTKLIPVEKCPATQGMIVEQHNFNHQDDYLDWLKDKDIKQVCPYSHGEGCIYTCLLRRGRNETY